MNIASPKPSITTCISRPPYVISTIISYMNSILRFHIQQLTSSKEYCGVWLLRCDLQQTDFSNSNLWRNWQTRSTRKYSLTSADTATASNQSSQFRARNRGRNLVSKFDTTAIFTPAFLKALNTFSAFGSQRCHAFRQENMKTT